MSKKNSLGHNPLAYSLRNHASFDFIRDNNSGKDASEEKKVSKKVASYYLEETVVDSIREIAEKEDESYSHIANRFLKDSIKKTNNNPD